MNAQGIMLILGCCLIIIAGMFAAFGIRKNIYERWLAWIIIPTVILGVTSLVIAVTIAITQGATK